jgi:hypothetical protein
MMRHLSRINDEDVTKEDLQGAEDTLNERKEEAARVRREKEEENEKLMKE